jgi:hypothetical protein
MNRTFGAKFTKQSDDGKSRRNVKSCLVIVVTVVEHATDARAENAGDAE